MGRALRREAGAALSKLDVFEATVNPYTVRVSPPFITGVGPKAASTVAGRLVAALTEASETGMPAHASARA